MRYLIMRNTLLFFLFILHLTGFCDTLQVQNAVKNKLMVKGDQYYPPFEFLNEKGEPDGFNVALFKKIADELKLDYAIELGPWWKVRKELTDGKIDLLVGVLVSDERAKYFNFSLPHSMMNFRVITRKGFNVNSLDDLKGKSIVVQKADLMNDIILAKNIAENLILAKDQHEALRMIQSGKYDAAIIGGIQAAYLIQEYKLKGLVSHNVGIDPAPYALATYKGNEALIEQINAALFNLKENGTYDALYNEWFQVYEEHDFFVKYGFALLVSAISFMVLLLFLLLLHLRIKVVKLRLRQSEDIYRLLVQSQRDVVLKLTRHGTILYASPSFCNLVDKKPEQLYQSSLSQLVNSEAWLLFRQEIQQVSHQNPNANLEQEVFISHKSFWVSWSISIVENEKADETEILAVGRDITAHKKAEKKLASSEARFRQLIQKIPNIAVQGYGADGTVRYWNSASENLYGYPAKEAIGKKLYDLIILPDHMSNVRAAVELMMSTGHSTPSGEMEMKHKDGSTVEVYSSHAIISLLSGERELFCMDVDISDIKQAQLVQKVLFNITNAVHLNRKLEDLLNIISLELNSLMEYSSLYIAFYDKENDMFSSMSETDDIEDVPEWPAEGSLTGKVVKEKRSILIKSDEFKRQVEKGEFELVGEPSAAWLGVPLFADDEVFGAVVVQNYTNPNAYDQKSMDLMEFVSRQISLAIQRQQNLIGLVEAKKNAEESDRLKTAFLNNLSHEIRTPLNGIVGLTTLFDDAYTTQEDRKVFSEMISENSRQLTVVIDDIIQIAALEAGQESVRLKVIDLHEILNELFTRYSLRNSNTKLELKADITLDAKFKAYVTDKEKLLKILEAILDNALKFTEEGRVIMACYSTDQQLHISVQDTGIGIAPEDQERVFERFQKIETEQNTLFRGNGLGLALVRAYVALLEGEIKLFSTPGQGTTIHIILPAQADYKSHLKEKTMNKIPPIKKMLKILIVEDEYTNMFFLKSAFKGQQFELVTVGNGEMAVAAFEQSPDFDLVLMDLKLPLMNGFKATAEIKKIRSEVPVIAVTAYALRGDKEKALAAGCDDYIAKPFLKTELIGIISKYVKLPLE